MFKFKCLSAYGLNVKHRSVPFDSTVVPSIFQQFNTKHRNLFEPFNFENLFHRGRYLSIYILENLNIFEAPITYQQCKTMNKSKLDKLSTYSSTNY